MNTVVITTDLTYPCGAVMPRGTVVHVQQVLPVRDVNGDGERFLVEWRGRLWQVCRNDCRMEDA